MGQTKIKHLLIPLLLINIYFMNNEIFTIATERQNIFTYTLYRKIDEEKQWEDLRIQTVNDRYANETGCL